MFLIDAIKPIEEKKFKNCFIFYATDELRAYKIKPVLFLYAVGFLAATKNTQKKEENFFL